LVRTTGASTSGPIKPGDDVKVNIPRRDNTLGSTDGNDIFFRKMRDNFLDEMAIEIMATMLEAKSCNILAP
jgi:hypothetical protein